MSIIIRMWRKLIYGGDPYVRQHELDALKAFQDYLPKPDKNKFKEQLKRLDIVQRMPGGSTVLFYDLDDLKNSKWPETILFDDKSSNKIVTTVKVSVLGKDGHDCLLSCKINCQFGSFFGLKFNKDLDDLVDKSILERKVKIPSALE